MSNDNPNNTPHWRNKLDELEHLPGSSFSSDAAWDQLYGRLRGNKKNKKILWYLIAAASLVFALMITVLNYHKNTSETSNKETTIKQEKEINKPTVKDEEVDKNRNENNNVPERDKIASVNKPIQRKHRITITEVATKVRSSDDVAINYPGQEPIAKSLQIVGNSTTAVGQPKKKLNVVHINELGDPVMESPDITRIEDIHSFQLKFGNGEVLSNSPIASKSSGLIILKTKPSSN